MGLVPRMGEEMKLLTHCVILGFLLYVLVALILIPRPVGVRMVSGGWQWFLYGWAVLSGTMGAWFL
jgi:hypothetical protein